jgi:hypothetical protein
MLRLAGGAEQQIDDDGEYENKIWFGLFFRNLALGGVTDSSLCYAGHRTEMKQKKKGKCHASTSRKLLRRLW